MTGRTILMPRDLSKALVDEVQGIGILGDCSDLSLVKAVRLFCIDLQFDIDVTARKSRELFDDSFDDLMNFTRRTVRRDHYGADKPGGHWVGR